MSKVKSLFSSKVFLAFIALCACLIGIGFFFWMTPSSSSTLINIDSRSLSQLQINSTQKGMSTWGDLFGHSRLVYFGYTSCPDICPTALARLTRTLEIIEGTKDRQVSNLIRPLFVTVDPKRDTITVLSDYVINFHPRLIGITGSKESLGTLYSIFKVFSKMAPGFKGKQNYLMYHSSFLYLVNKKGDIVGIFDDTLSPRKLAQKIIKILY